MDDHSVTLSVQQLAEGDDAAAGLLWDRFFPRLVTFARSRAKNLPSGVIDEEDIALSAFKSVCLGVRDGKFPRLNDREGLWKLLLTIAARKTADKVAFELRDKRNARRTQPLEPGDELRLLLREEPTAETQAEFSDLLESLLDRLQHADLKQVALLKLENYSNAEIAQHISKSLATVERKLRTIRTIWGTVA